MKATSKLTGIQNWQQLKAMQASLRLTVAQEEAYLKARGEGILKAWGLASGNHSKKKKGGGHFWLRVTPLLVEAAGLIVGKIKRKQADD